LYSLDQVRVIEIETTNTCNASCPQCLRTNEETLAPTEFNDTLNFERILPNIPLSFWRRLERINFNGTSGDNIAHNNIKDIVVTISSLAPQAKIKVSTNGSLRSKDWWADFGTRIKDTNVEVVFGIDGLLDTHKLYRVGTDFNKIIDNATAFINAGGRAVWQMILFDHNLHQVDQCRNLAKELKFQEFYLRNENRFPKDVQEQTVFWKGNATHTIRYPTANKLTAVLNKNDIVNSWSQALAPLKKDKKINCRSMETKWLSIYADGTVWPCCWLMGWHKATHLSQHSLVNYHFKKIIGLDFNQINLYTSKLEDIVNSNIWQEKYPTSFEKAPNPVCIQQCSR
jgi:MoaA/NifB/PqqE/SkfB family radical SAM enzyme